MMKPSMTSSHKCQLFFSSSLSLSLPSLWLGTLTAPVALLRQAAWLDFVKSFYGLIKKEEPTVRR